MVVDEISHFGGSAPDVSHEECTSPLRTSFQASAFAGCVPGAPFERFSGAGHPAAAALEDDETISVHSFYHADKEAPGFSGLLGSFFCGVAGKLEEGKQQEQAPRAGKNSEDLPAGL